MLAYLALVTPFLARRGFDSSVFVLAGDKFVAAGQTPSPIIVGRHSDGYDGQFYYRLALGPLAPQAQAFGVTLDHPAWRMQRILLPVLARIVAAGQPALMPAALFTVNLACVFAIGWIAMSVARARAFPPVVPLAIVAWPGLLIALTHDTTEILAAALLLAGVAAWMAQRCALGAVLLALATLSRETSILAVAGVLLVSLRTLVRSRAERRAWAQAACAAAALLPFFVWRHVVTAIWHETPQGPGAPHNAGWPLLGLAQTFLANIFNHAVGMAHKPRDLTMRVTALWGAAMLVWFCTQTARAALRQLPQDRSGLVLGWLLILALMSVLTANGPWIEPTAWLRAFTECWVLGWIVLGLAGAAPRHPWVLLALSVPLLLRNWELCWIQTKG